MAIYAHIVPILLWSFPTRGAWIEIVPLWQTEEYKAIVAPHAGSVDRNAYNAAKIDDGNRSLPTRGAWIEMMQLAVHLERAPPSLPTRGAWIEIRTS